MMERKQLSTPFQMNGLKNVSSQFTTVEITANYYT
jgi:hypothetical protein